MAPRTSHVIGFSFASVSALFCAVLLARIQVQPLPKWEINDVGGTRGKTVVATKSLQPGDLILSEKPLVIVPRGSFADRTEEDIARVIEGRLGTNTTNRELYEELSNSHPYYSSKIYGIHETNAIRLHDDDNLPQQPTGVFYQASRFNHACHPNAAYRWSPTESLLKVHVISPIKGGEEITFSYIEWNRPRENRQQVLQKEFGFKCQCFKCSISDEELIKKSDQRLMEITNNRQKLELWMEGQIGGGAAIKILVEMWKLMEREGIRLGRGQVAEDGALIAASHGDHFATAQWAALSSRWWGIERGTDSLSSKKMKGVVTDPTSHEAWKSKPPVEVWEWTDLRPPKEFLASS